MFAQKVIDGPTAALIGVLPHEEPSERVYSPEGDRDIRRRLIAAGVVVPRDPEVPRDPVRSDAPCLMMDDIGRVAAAEHMKNRWCADPRPRP